jgi:hypothetical protein
MSAIELQIPGGADGWADYDGVWSTFNLIVGNNTAQEQHFRVVPSTLSLATWLPANDTCDIAPDVTSCVRSRGIGLRGGNQSTGYLPGYSDSYLPLSVTTIDIGELVSIDDLYGAEYKSSLGTAGLDVVSVLDSDGGTKISANLLTSVYADNSLYFILSTLGLGVGTWKGQSGLDVPSLMEVLASQGSISSRSWGYTAGAVYRKLMVQSYCYTTLIHYLMIGRFRSSSR